MTATERYQRKLANFRATRKRSIAPVKVRLRKPSVYVEMPGGTPLSIDDPKSQDAIDLMVDMFFSSDGRERVGLTEYRLAAEWISSGQISVSKFTYRRPRVPAKHHRLYGAYLGSRYSGSDWHQDLKWNAHNLLRALGSRTPLYEQQWAHGRADVVCSSLGVAMECGDTHPGNAVVALNDTGTREFWLLPFIYHKDGTATAYRFRRGPNWSGSNA